MSSTPIVYLQKFSPCSLLAKSSGDNETSGSLLYPESPVLDELNESLRFISCAILSFGKGAGAYETSLQTIVSIAQKRKLAPSKRCRKEERGQTILQSRSKDATMMSGRVRQMFRRLPGEASSSSTPPLRECANAPLTWSPSPKDAGPGRGGVSNRKVLPFGDADAQPSRDGRGFSARMGWLWVATRHAVEDR